MLLVISKEIQFSRILVMTSAIKKMISISQISQSSSMLMRQFSSLRLFFKKIYKLTIILRSYTHHHFFQKSRIYWKMINIMKIITLLRISWWKNRKSSQACSWIREIEIFVFNFWTLTSKELVKIAVPTLLLTYKIEIW